MGSSQPLVGGRSWGPGWTRDVRDREMQSKARVTFSPAIFGVLYLKPNFDSVSQVGWMQTSSSEFAALWGYSSNVYGKKHVLNEMPSQHWKFRSPGAPEN